MRDPLPRRRFPCAECPWRKDTPPGQFTAERYEALRDTSTQPEVASVADVLNQPMFACHKTAEGREQACAGWLAVAAHEHLGIRLAASQGRLPAEALEPGPDWPPLFETYDEMVERQGAVKSQADLDQP